MPTPPLETRSSSHLLARPSEYRRRLLADFAPAPGVFRFPFSIFRCLLPMLICPIIPPVSRRSNPSTLPFPREPHRAGEVIERPARGQGTRWNAIDARATRDHRRDRGRRRESSAIIDNGSGIPAAELRSPSAPHNHSKLTCDDDSSHQHHGLSAARPWPPSARSPTPGSSPARPIPTPPTKSSTRRRHLRSPGRPGKCRHHGRDPRPLFQTFPPARKFLRAPPRVRPHLRHLLRLAFAASAHRLPPAFRRAQIHRPAAVASPEQRLLAAWPRNSTTSPPASGYRDAEIRINRASSACPRRPTPPRATSSST